ncbi:MAG: LysR family transcriptional regulator [Betaproteobacteria bacterium]|uniref:LysR family transcriptional regulator n=1 Tax=Candidatus Proximibacter danicus TaxID=2954365 RepID=A0A9D7PSJ8_9PROT|nr:LysR family transcriptional regulator [Candidatus Proximibacter danicus]
MELRQLRYFCAIARCGSFSKAAGEVFVAQSALSHQLAQLEEELGTPLFHRTRRGVELTEAGRVFTPTPRPSCVRSRMRRPACATPRASRAARSSSASRTAPCARTPCSWRTAG